MGTFDSMLGGECWENATGANTRSAGQLRQDASEDGESWPVVWQEEEALVSCLPSSCAVKAASGSTLHYVIRDRQRRTAQ